MNAATSLRRAGVALRAVGASLRKAPPPPPPPLDLSACVRALETVGARAVRVGVDARREPWTPAGLEAGAGAPVTWLAHGDSWMVNRRGIHLSAALQLRLRTGGAGPSVAGTGPTHTASAPNTGPVELCCVYPAELQGSDERLVYDRVPRAAMRGGFGVVVATWPERTDVRSRLTEAAERDPTGLCRREADRLGEPVAPPDGWRPHPQIPLTGLHRLDGDRIEVRSGGDVEIVCRDAHVPLTPTLRLRWRWRLDALPARDAEDTLLTHDYLSVAVEFDDGQDLTYFWSAALPAETSFRCPLPHWRLRETHLVVRTGRDGLGAWRQEERTLAPDHARAIGGPSPREVSRVWLIVTTVAQRREGRAGYADIELVDGETRTRIL